LPVPSAGDACGSNAEEHRQDSGRRFRHHKSRASIELCQHDFHGEKRFRFCLPNTRFLLHQPMGGVQGPATDIDIEAREIIKMRERLSQIIATETGQSIERVRKDTDRNYWMSASEAIDYGLA
jgi:hypothetical protein